MQRGRVDGGVWYTCIHILVHLHILTKVLDKNWMTGIYMWDPTQGCTCIYENIWYGELCGHANMYDEFTHLKQAVGPEGG